MGRYSYSERKRAAAKKRGVHPIWQGFGCVVIILLPIMSYALADATIKAGIKGKWSFLPYDLLGRPEFPDIVWKYWQIARFFRPITQIDNLYANLVLTGVYALILGGLASVIYAFVYRYIGPPRYGPQDVPQPKIRTKIYKR